MSQSLSTIRPFRMVLAVALVALAALAALALAPQASAAPLPCEDSCTFNTPCSQSCRNGTFNTTCGGYGVCKYPPPKPACYSFKNEGYGEAFGFYPFPCYVGYRQIAMGAAISDYERHNGSGSWDKSCNKEIGPNLCTCTQTGYQTKWNCIVRAQPPRP